MSAAAEALGAGALALGAAWPGGVLVVCLAALVGLAGLDAALAALPRSRLVARPQLGGAAAANAQAAARVAGVLRRPVRTLIALWLSTATAWLPAAAAAVAVAVAARAPPAAALTVPLWLPAVVVPAQLWARSLARRDPLGYAARARPLLVAATLPFVPVAMALQAVGRGLGRRLPSAALAPFWPPEVLATEVQAHGLFGRGGELLRSLREFSDTTVREIMVPRTEMVVASSGASPAELCAVLRDGGHSRVPVYDDTVDHIVGILHVKDLFLARLDQTAGPMVPADPSALRAMLRAAFYVPEMMQASALLREFQRRKTHLAVVVDEYGGTAGVVTLEDILEEIVGEIQDEYDVEEKQFRVHGDKIIADGRVSIWDIEKALGVSFPDDAEYETLAGFLMSRIGQLPEAGAVIAWNGLRFTVKEAGARRIGTVEIDRPPAGA